MNPQSNNKDGPNCILLSGWHFNITRMGFCLNFRPPMLPGPGIEIVNSFVLSFIKLRLMIYKTDFKNLFPSGLIV